MGANGYVPKSAPIEEIVNAMRQVLRPGIAVYVSPEFEEGSDWTRDRYWAVDHMSAAEEHFFRQFVTTPDTRKAFARQLGISTKQFDNRMRAVKDTIYDEMLDRSDPRAPADGNLSNEFVIQWGREHDYHYPEEQASRPNEGRTRTPR